MTGATCKVWYRDTQRAPWTAPSTRSHGFTFTARAETKDAPGKIAQGPCRRLPRAAGNPDMIGAMIDVYAR